MNTSLNYKNRQVDIEVLQSIQNPSSTQRVMTSIVSKEPKYVTGVEKLIQRYAILLLTQLNSVHFDPSFGSSLMTDLSRTSISNLQILNVIFAEANSAVMSMMQSEDDNNMYGTASDDEILKSASLSDLRVNSTNGAVEFIINITTKSDDSLTFIIPTTNMR